MTKLCQQCGTAPATHYAAADQDCGNVDAYELSCDSCAPGDYEYCLVCLGHIDGNESAGCKRCECFIPAA